MKIKAIQIDNYRSFGEANSFTFDSNIIGLIGQNGVGKTNALQALSRLRFFTDDVPTVIPESAINQNTGGSPRVSLYVYLEEDDLAVLGDMAIGPYGHDVHEDLNTSLSFRYDVKRNRTRLDFTGAFFNSLVYHPKMVEIRKKVQELLKHLETVRNNISEQDYENIVEMFGDYYTIFVPRLDALVQWCVQYLPNIVGQEWKDKVVPLVKEFGDEVGRHYKAFASVSPVIVLFEDLAEFPNAYHVDDIERWDDQRLGRDSKIALARYLSAIDVSRADLISAFRSKDSRVRSNLRSRIIKRTREVIADFNMYYRNNSAGVELTVGFDGQYLRFDVGNKQDDGGVPWSDASAGVRWYLSAFFELRHALRNRNALVLVDEPAIHLHVSAQREALTLLQGLARETKYVLYTTHNPSMIDVARLGDVRAVVRVGEASYFRSLSQMEDVASRMEALTPICSALGYNMSASLVPNATRLNLITEGKTDAQYVNVMMDVLGVEPEDRPIVLSSQGAPSIQHVLAILIGWGVPFKVLLDTDDEGEKAYRQLKSLYGADIGCNLFRVSREKGMTIESLISRADLEKTCPEDVDIREFEHAKAERATRFAVMFGQGGIKPDEETCKNFKELFFALEILVPTLDEAVALACRNACGRQVKLQVKEDD